MPNIRHRQGQRNPIFGVVPAIVTNNKDPDGQYRVRVRFPWMPNGGDSGGEESDWARVATVGAGKERGSFFLPEVGDEVLCAFEHGDIGAPFVIGALWNSQSTSHSDNKKGPNDGRSMKSRSGHVIEVSDDKSNKKEHITVTSKGGAQVKLDDTDGKLKIWLADQTAKNTVLLDHTNKKLEIISAEGDIKITVKGAMKIDANEISWTSKQATTWKADGNAKISASSKLVGKAGSQGTIQSDAAMTIKGGPKVDINP